MSYKRVVMAVSLIGIIFVLIAVAISAPPPQDDGRTERMMAYCDALGVGCDYCHDESNYKKPTRNKKVTQTMEKWTQSLRKKSDKKKVTCNDCHQGKAKFLEEKAKK